MQPFYTLEGDLAIADCLERRDFSEMAMRHFFNTLISMSITVLQKNPSSDNHTKMALQDAIEVQKKLAAGDYDSKCYSSSLISSIQDKVTKEYRIADIEELLATSTVGVVVDKTIVDPENTDKTVRYRIPISKVFRQSIVLENDTMNQLSRNNDTKEAKIRQSGMATIKAKFVLWLLTAIFEAVKTDSLLYGVISSQLKTAIEEANKKLHQNEEKTAKGSSIFKTILDAASEFTPGFKSIVENIGIETQVSEVKESLITDGKNLDVSAVKDKGLDIWNKLVKITAKENVEKAKKVLRQIGTDQENRKSLRSIVGDILGYAIKRITEDDCKQLVLKCENDIKQAAIASGQVEEIPFSSEKFFDKLPEVDIDTLSSALVGLSIQS